ncbi:selenocysteine insertion sequence-binding protein 2 [Drosophila tropicalis]|uniref:selenocysteine insertion sequence-binding protein 2 n=1 Tax=Drosophila tropicalis TaxID=46794 RepID=UPI0035ABA140
MSRNSDKLNIIDHSTYDNLHKDIDSAPTKMLRSYKYKNKHKYADTLFDFICRMPCRKPKKQGQIKKEQQLLHQRKKSPNFSIIKTIVNKRKVKCHRNLVTKEKITRLKRSIRSYRNLKQAAAHNEATTEQPETNNHLLHLSGAERIDLPHQEKDQSMAETSSSQLELEARLQGLSINEANKGHSIHSRRFRSYCDNCTSAQLKKITTQLLKDLDRFQKRAYAANEIKARAHPRLVLGFREAISHLNIKNKVKLLILATDCESNPGEHGLDETINKIKFSCQQHNVPYCFSLMRRELAYTFKKRAQISCVAILDYDGAQDTYKDLLLELDEARKDYKRLTAL